MQFNAFLSVLGSTLSNDSSLSALFERNKVQLVCIIYIPYSLHLKSLESNCRASCFANECDAEGGNHGVNFRLSHVKVHLTKREMK